MRPERYRSLPEATWPRLRALLDPHPPGSEAPVNMTIGEPKHPFPDWVTDELARHAEGWGRYPSNDGLPVLLEAIADWIARRYGVQVEPGTQIMALNGTREGLYNACLALSPDPGPRPPTVLIPNPFYPVYGIAALSAGAEPVYLPCTAETGHLPDFAAVSPETLDRVAIVYLCSPANPQGTVASEAYWGGLLALAERHDFRIFSDECYSEIYRGAPPPGGLEMVARHGADPERVTVFHSLSKRSNLPGLRSGFVAGGPRTMAEIKRLRAGAGAPLPNPIQEVSATLWADEDHVVENRRLYRAEFDLADHIFAGIDAYRSPEAGFFLWLAVGNGEEAARRLWTEVGVRTMPGAYLSREVDGQNPGAAYIRAALVAPYEETRRGLEQIREWSVRNGTM
ncbi:MAG: aminotransferase class I/II-fold pyridoxal phosphate-dependent enzyme [Shimia sp.]